MVLLCYDDGNDILETSCLFILFTTNQIHNALAPQNQTWGGSAPECKIEMEVSIYFLSFWVTCVDTCHQFRNALHFEWVNAFGNVAFCYPQASSFASCGGARTQDHQLGAHWSTIQQATCTRLSCKRVHSTGIIWALRSVFCVSISVESDCLSSDPIPLLQNFAQQGLRSGTIRPPGHQPVGTMNPTPRRWNTLPVTLLVMQVAGSFSSPAGGNTSTP